MKATLDRLLGETGRKRLLLHSTSQKRNSRDVQKKTTIIGGRIYTYDSITLHVCIVEIAVFINVNSFQL